MNIKLTIIAALVSLTAIGVDLSESMRTKLLNYGPAYSEARAHKSNTGYDYILYLKTGTPKVPEKGVIVSNTVSTIVIRMTNGMAKTINKSSLVFPPPFDPAKK